MEGKARGRREKQREGGKGKEKHRKYRKKRPTVPIPTGFLATLLEATGIGSGATFFPLPLAADFFVFGPLAIFPTILSACIDTAKGKDKDVSAGPRYTGQKKNCRLKIPSRNTKIFFWKIRRQS